MPHPSSILILGTDSSEISAVIKQLETEPDLKLVDSHQFDIVLDHTELDYIDAVLILPKAEMALWKFLIENKFRGPLIGMGFGGEGVTEQIPVPVKANFLVHRIKAQIRNFQSRPETFLSIGSFKLYPALRLFVSPAGDELKLTDKEVDILRYLHRARGAIISRDELLTNIWGYHESVTTHTLETHIYRLRQKIETNIEKAAILMTEPGGYRLAGMVEEN